MEKDKPKVRRTLRSAIVVKIRRSQGKIIQDCDIYIGRRINMGGWNLPDSKWRNPFSVKEYGREKALIKYEKYLHKSGLINDIEELRGKVLGCWCHPEPCHGHILVRLLNERF